MAKYCLNRQFSADHSHLVYFGSATGTKLCPFNMIVNYEIIANRFRRISIDSDFCQNSFYGVINEYIGAVQREVIFDFTQQW